jgi:phosphoserine phosphatase
VRPGQYQALLTLIREDSSYVEPNRRRAEAGPAPVQAAVRRPQRVAAVAFDCDSTLTAIEGIDELAQEQRAAIAALTDAAMDGALPLEAVYGKRLELIRPGRARLEALGQLYIERMVPDAREVVAALQREGIDVRIISGGLAPAVHASARVLGVPPAAVAAVGFVCEDRGQYARFDENSPQARAGGKADILGRWRGDVAPLMMVGDGATDLEARDVVDVFVAYAGVVERAAVVAGADVVIRSASLAPVVPLALGGEAPRDAASRPLFERGLQLIEEAYGASLFHSTR